MVAERSSIFQSGFTNPMATAEQMAALLHSQTQTNEAMMSRMMEAFFTQFGTLMPKGGHPAGPSLNERRYRDVGKFSGDEGTSSLKFRSTIKECDVALFQALELAGESEIEVTKAHVESISMDRPLECFTTS